MIVMQTGKPLSLFFIDRSHSGAVIKPMLCIPVQYLTGRCGIIQKRIFFFQRDIDPGSTHFFLCQMIAKLSQHGLCLLL